MQYPHFTDEKEAGWGKGHTADEWQGQASNLAPLGAEVMFVLNLHRCSSSSSSTQHVPRSFGSPSSSVAPFSFRLVAYV